MTRELQVIKSALRNWGLWARIDAMPDLSIPEPPWATYWAPRNAREDGWGTEAPPTDPRPAVDESWALAIDGMLKRVSVQHFKLLKAHYVEDRIFRTEDVDAACRALLDAINAQPFSSKKSPTGG